MSQNNVIVVGEKKIIIVDIDGTIADQDHRVHFLEGESKDWDSYFAACDGDAPIKPIIDLVGNIDNVFYDTYFCTGRTEDIRDKTEAWLMKHFGGDDDPDVECFTHNKLLMRKSGYFRHDKIIKPELLAEAGIKQEDVAFILEDRNSMVKKWRELGFTCLQVAEGDF